VLSKDIRNKFLEFFKSKKHTVVPSDSLVPKADPTLLFTSAGMNQFKEQFLGHNVTYKRAATSQKCLRTADLDKVGKTPSHHTFFEMLGNFSFGDYFKKEAIEWAWEFMTEVLGIKKEKLWVSVYKDDKESYDIWLKDIKVPKKKIVKMGAKDNFWPSNAPKDGPNGPCGPCSEIFYDWGNGKSVEVWNLVFTQFERKEGGKLDPLPNKNIDTGMGLERITSVMQGVKTNFETDLFIPIIEEIKKHNPKLKTRNLNAIADHVRAATFAIADGIAPSNEERGYVIRKLIRRAYLHSGAEEPFLYNLVPKVVEVMKEAYPELLQKREEITLVVKEEEEKFCHTISVTMPLLHEALDAVKDKTLKGKEAFKLFDTYGLPLEVIEEEARKKHIGIDTKAFQKLMDQRRELSRKGGKFKGGIFDVGADTEGKRKIKRNHTATHLLQAALRKVLGEHAHQAGSFVEAGRLRFDFTHTKKVTERELERIESLVNDCIEKGLEVRKEEKTLNEAKAEGAIALFTEKYSGKVTVYSCGDFSKEVCGGPHVENTKDISFFKITHESSVASGVRRVEAFTSDEARKWVEESEKKKTESERAEKKKEEKKALEKKKLKSAEGDIDVIISEAKVIKDVKVIIKEIENANMGILRSLSAKIKSKTKSAFIFLESKDGDKVNMVLTGTKDLISGGLDAEKVIKKAAPIVNGSGGGRPDFAQAGGKDPSKISELFEFIEKTATDII